MEQNNKCNFGKCDKNAEFHVVFALGANATHPPAMSSPILSVCKEHSDVEWKDVCDDNGWKLITSQFEGKGLMPPLKEFSWIEIIPIKK